MKKVLLSVFAVVAFVATSNAQVSGGAKAGLNLAKLSSSADGFESDMKLAFAVGGFLDVELSDKIGFQPELLLSFQGDKNEDSFGGVDYKSTTKLSYLNIPLMLKYKFSDAFNFQVGPQVGLLMGAKVKVEAGDDEVEEDIKDELSGTDFGLNFGFGYELESGLLINARYNLGLSDIADENDGDAVKNSVIQITVGYKLF